MWLLLFGAPVLLLLLWLAKTWISFLSASPSLSVSRDPTASVRVRSFGGVHLIDVSDPVFAAQVQASPAAQRMVVGLPKTSLFTAATESDHARFKFVMGKCMRAFTLRNSVIERLCDDAVAELKRVGVVHDTFEFVLSLVSAAMVRFAFGSQVPQILIKHAGGDTSAGGLLMLMAPRVFGLLFPAKRQRNSDARAARAAVLSEIRAGEHKDSMLAVMDAANAELRAEGSTNALSDDELISNAVGVGIGGSDSTTSGIVSALHAIACDGAAQERVRAEFAAVDRNQLWHRSDFDALLPFTRGVIEEVVRCRPPFGGLVPRVLSEDCKIGQHELKRNNIILVNLKEVNRSQAPLTLNFDTPTTGHMSFGAGPKACNARSLAVRLSAALLAFVVGEFQVSMLDPSDSSLAFNERTRVVKPAKPLSLKFSPRKEFFALSPTF
jgi:cytochrome P450